MGWSGQRAPSSRYPRRYVRALEQSSCSSFPDESQFQEMIVNIIRVRQGFLTVGPRLPGGSEQFFRDVSTSTFVIKSCLYNTQTVILDAVVVSPTCFLSPCVAVTHFLTTVLLVDLSHIHRLAERMDRRSTLPGMVWSAL